MKKLSMAMMVSLAGLAFTQTAHAVLVQHHSKTISLLETSDGSCVFFQLTGVTEANPAVPNGVWFAIEKTQKEMYALLLGAHLSERTLTRVLTNGEVVCGAAKALTIDL